MMLALLKRTVSAPHSPPMLGRHLCRRAIRRTMSSTVPPVCPYAAMHMAMRENYWP